MKRVTFHNRPFFPIYRRRIQKLTHFWPVPLLTLITKIPGSTSVVIGTRPWRVINLPDPAPIRRGHEIARNTSCYDFYELSKFLSPRLLLCKSIKTAQSFNVFFNRNEKKTKEACHYGGTGGECERGKQNFWMLTRRIHLVDNGFSNKNHMHHVDNNLRAPNSIFIYANGQES